MCVCVIDGRGHPLYIRFKYSVSCRHKYVHALNLFSVGSAENEESSSDVQAEGGKPSGMYCY